VAVTCWFVENKGENRSTPSNDTIGRALAALHDPRVVSDRYELRDNATRYIVGVKLNSHGLEYHERGITADLFEGKTVNTTSSSGIVNKSIPAAWDAKPKIIAMRVAHSQHAENSKKEVSRLSDGSSVTDASVTEKSHGRKDVDPSNDPLF
jgi:hypothetical protein